MKNPEHEITLTERARLAAAELYSPELPYHNFDHAQNVVSEASKIADDCDQEGVPINREALELAAIFHDAGYHRDYKQEGFKSKEELSAALAKNTLQDLGADPELIKQVQATILATRWDSDFTTNEQKAIRAADLAGIAKDFESFVENNRRIRKEFEILYKTKVPWDTWKRETEKIISFYLSQDIRLTSRHDDEQGRSIFHKNTKKILEQFLNLSDDELEGKNV